MKMKLVILLVIISSITLASTAFAVPKGQTLVYTHTGDGTKIIFDGTVHSLVGVKCSDCHGSIFMSVNDAKKSNLVNGGPTKITMADIYAGKYCGACHNGKKSFAVKKDDKESCVRCHRK
ncbi:MAG: cytochrome C [Nitrospirae bacterium]|nr:cytochrome C [Nitrospirota bacterium]